MKRYRIFQYITSVIVLSTISYSTLAISNVSTTPESAAIEIPIGGGPFWGESCGDWSYFPTQRMRTCCKYRFWTRIGCEQQWETISNY